VQSRACIGLLARVYRAPFLTQAVVRSAQARRHPVSAIPTNPCGGTTGEMKMALPEFSMRQLLEAGAHFGHQTHRWNPKMDKFIFGVRSNIHIIDLSQSVPLLHQALVKVRDTAGSGGRILFVGTKRQAAEHVAASAKRSAQYFVNHRWLGGTLTNWQTISNSIRRLRELNEILGADGPTGRTKKELLTLSRERERLDRSLGGIASMGGLPSLMFVIDTNKEAIAIKEARKLGIPVVAVVDSNCDPDDVDFPIPGNDDAARAIQLYCDLIADAALDGLAAGQAAMGVDLGAAENPTEPGLRSRRRRNVDASASDSQATDAATAEPAGEVSMSYVDAIAPADEGAIEQTG
jgi:small subunit ribosomal protein S2